MVRLVLEDGGAVLVASLPFRHSWWIKGRLPVRAGDCCGDKHDGVHACLGGKVVKVRIAETCKRMIAVRWMCGGRVRASA